MSMKLTDIEFIGGPLCGGVLRVETAQSVATVVVGVVADKNGFAVIANEHQKPAQCAEYGIVSEGRYNFIESRGPNG